ncbi:MAG TPA: response regulator [Jiangellales bacterium]|nr:response regulator [Jiangellales bacterium]
MIRVLVVEDDPLLAEAHRRYVERVDGFTPVGVVHSGASALAFLGREPVDLVLLDFFLPDTSGLDVCRELRRAGHPADVLAVTSARDLDLVRAAVSLGVVQYVLKPFTFALFREKLESYAAYRAELDRAEGGDAVQQDVERLFAALRRPSVAGGLPKGFSAETYERVLDHLRRAGEDVSASDLAEAVGASRVTARRYLEHLADQGLADKSLRYGGAGRPEQLYRWRAT